jgi:DNA mismatch repair protein MutS2
MEAAEREREEAEILRREITELHRTADRERERLEKQRDKIIAEAKDEARRVVEKARIEAEAAIKEIRQLKHNRQSNAEKEIQQSRDRIRAAGEEVIESMRVERLTPPPKDLKPGEAVVLLESQQPATVLTVPDEKGGLTVQAGIMKLSTNVDKLKRASAESKKTDKSDRASKLRLGNVPRELDIRGQNAEDGLMEVDHYLDEAIMAGLTEVNIIHGKGTGKLRSAIQDHLRRHPHVKAFRLGRYGEGEDGVTVVTLNQ